MSIAHTLIKQILANNDLRNHYNDYDVSHNIESEDGIVLPDLFFDAPELHVFHERNPDSAEEFSDDPSKYSVLGTYRWMASPGMITLYSRNIEAYWKSLLRHANRQFPFITTKDSERVLIMLVRSVYQHERFHYLCDFCRRMLGNSTFDRWHEEALAVAWESHWLKSQSSWNTFYGLMHPTLRRIVIQDLFDHHAPGYRDWRQFANRQDFHDAVTAYLYPANAKFFAGTAFNFAEWALTHVPDDNNRAWDEQIK